MAAVLGFRLTQSEVILEDLKVNITAVDGDMEWVGKVNLSTVGAAAGKENETGVNRSMLAFY